MHLPVINPTTEALIDEIPDASPSEVDAAVGTAEGAAASWYAVPPPERATVLRQLSSTIREHTEELAQIDTEDAGLPIAAARTDVLRACDELDYFAGLVTELKGITIPSDPIRLAYTTRRPYGAVGRIVPFNHPIRFAIGKIAAPLVAGNAIVLKPSEHTSLSAMQLSRLANEILPPGLLTVVTGRGSVAGQALAAHSRVRRLAFTGGIEAGRLVQQATASSIKHVTLELGGKNPLVVFPDVDPKSSARAAVGCLNLRSSMGQSCQAVSRAFIHESLYDAWLPALLEEMGKLRLGDPLDQHTDLGPLAHEAHYRRVRSFIDEAINAGFSLQIGGGRPSSIKRGYYVEPTVFSQVDPQSDLARREIFGPVLAVFTWRNVDDLIRAVNDVDYGLAARIWTNSLGEAHSIARRLNAGVVWLNDDGGRPVGIPFGGVTSSGVGKEACLEELFSYTEEQSIIASLGRV